MLKLFRMASVAEGLSLLIILSVTIGWISRDYVYVLGMTHGALFLIYCVLSLPVSHRQGWSVVTWLLILGAAFFRICQMNIPAEITRMRTACTRYARSCPQFAAKAATRAISPRMMSFKVFHIVLSRIARRMQRRSVRKFGIGAPRVGRFDLGQWL